MPMKCHMPPSCDVMVNNIKCLDASQKVCVHDYIHDQQEIGGCYSCIPEPVMCFIIGLMSCHRPDHCIVAVGVSASFLTSVTTQGTATTCGGCNHTIAAHNVPFVCNDCNTADYRTCSGFSHYAANTVNSAGHCARPRCFVIVAPAPTQSLTSHLVSEPN